MEIPDPQEQGKGRFWGHATSQICTNFTKKRWFMIYQVTESISDSTSDQITLVLFSILDQYTELIQRAVTA